ncbi:hypothetical protein [Thiocystis violacea]|uniref:hypothetical protein n=1 Tax=Thiocystis violacea TaxID=13725 RepID=UPI001907DB43|nr:hypothetical protein [Thiocystis violacea]MBK1718946.1 hypothetical protein [Thiocystis violacea]
MKRYFKHRVDPGLGRWLDDLALRLIREGTRARRVLEAGLDAWGDDPLHLAGPDVLGETRLEARIRAIFTGHSDVPGMRAMTPSGRATPLDMEMVGRIRSRTRLIES